jgi:hypothetical protein
MPVSSQGRVAVQLRLGSTDGWCTDAPALRRAIRTPTRSPTGPTCSNRASGSAGDATSRASVATTQHAGSSSSGACAAAAICWITELVITYDGKPYDTVSIMEFRAGHVVHETQYFAEPFEAAAWRAQWADSGQRA